MSRTAALTVDFDRLRGDLNALSAIGRGDDQGLYRMAFTDADIEARRWLERRAADAGLDTTWDGAANVIVRRPDAPSDVPALVLGSHLDTVPAGGYLDGALGVVAGLECLRCLHDRGIATRHPVEVVAFADEEGRFGGMLGSRAMSGALTPDAIHRARDLDGVSLVDAMRAQGLDPLAALDARRVADSIHAYLELHIEQGPVLERRGTPIGVVEQIAGLFKWSVRLIGEADHAGTTPMDMRRDAFSGLAEFADEIPRVLEEHGGAESLATIGKADLFPGIANTVPGRVEFSLDVRDVDADRLAELGDALRRALSAIARRRHLMFEFDVVSEIAPVACESHLVDSLAAAAERVGVATHRMPSGAAHDAQSMAALTRIGMLFVPSKDGRSHSPAEWTHWEDIETGANVLLQAVLDVAETT